LTGLRKEWPKATNMVKKEEKRREKKGRRKKGKPVIGVRELPGL
jgi:hypothetical protein